MIKSSASTLAGSGLIPSAQNIMPQKLISLLAKLYFSGFSVNPASLKRLPLLYGLFVCVLIQFLLLGSGHHFLLTFSIDINKGLKATLSFPCGVLMPIVRRL